MMTEKQFNDFANQVFLRFDQVNGKFDQIDKRFDQIDQRFEQIDNRFEQVEQRFAENHVRWKRFTKKMYMRFEHLFVRLDEGDTIIGLVSYKFDLLQDQLSHHYTELKEANIRRDERVTRLEIWRSSYDNR
jgi:hypothetical protein